MKYVFKQLFMMKSSDAQIPHNRDFRRRLCLPHQ